MRERWDGNGYPDGLQGDAIPLLARIVAIAEPYDSMTSARPYRGAMSSEDALRQLWREGGGKFDPDIVEAFVMQRAAARVKATQQGNSRTRSAETFSSGDIAVRLPSIGSRGDHSSQIAYGIGRSLEQDLKSGTRW